MYVAPLRRNEMCRVICAGHVNWDVTLSVDRLPEADGEARITDQRQAGGGSASNVAVALAGLDCQPSLLGSVGGDEHGLLARRELEASGVETHLQEATELPTAVKYLLVDQAGQVAVLGNKGANEAYEATDLPTDTITGADQLHLTSQRPETATALARRGTEAGVTVSVDPGRRLGDRSYDKMLEFADWCFLNEREANIAADSECLAAVDRVVTKLGSGGARVDTSTETQRHPGFAVEAVDTTGAGDAFAAGFIAGMNAKDPAHGLAVGNACGALAAETMGARVELSWDAVGTLLEREADESR
jgi:ribokinase